MKKILAIAIIIIIAGIVLILIFPQEEVVNQKQTQSVPELRVAFIGDQNLGPDTIAVLELIKNERTQMVLHQGDFDYTDDPDKWDRMISNVLGSDFPLFASIGNHDVEAWSGYQEKLYDRLKKNPDAVCNGDLGVKSSCTYHGLFFILVAPGITGSGYDSFIEEQLSNTDYTWRICSWHYDMNIVQKNSTPNESGWEIYDACKNGGAIIANAHKHFYSRTKTLIDIKNQIVDPEWPNPDKLRVKEGATFVFVSALGGASIHSENTGISGGLFVTQDRWEKIYCNYLDLCKMDDRWGSIYTADQDATHGALFCTFNAEGQPNKANCYFKNINGKIIDEFTVTNFVGNA